MAVKSVFGPSKFCLCAAGSSPPNPEPGPKTLIPRHYPETLTLNLNLNANPCDKTNTFALTLTPTLTITLPLALALTLTHAQILGDKTAFGELAMQCKCKRSASVRGRLMGG